MINIIWVLFVVLGILLGMLTGKIDDVNSSIITSATESLNILINISPNIILFTGIMNILNDSGLINKISKIFYKLLGFLFKKLDKGNPSIGYMSTALLTNMLGLSNVSTPFSIKAIKELYDNDGVLNKNMITFLTLNISFVSIIPTTIISLRVSYNSINPSMIILPLVISSIITTVISLILNKLLGDIYD